MTLTPSVRSFWWLAEIDDDPVCHQKFNPLKHIEKCKDEDVDPWKGGRRTRESRMFADLHWDEESFIFHGHTDSSLYSGWICAQRRVGYAIGLKGMDYKKTMDLPDYLIIIDDDTFINLDLFVEKMKDQNVSEPRTFAGHVFKQKGFEFPWGGYGVFIPRASIERLVTPLYCNNTDIQGFEKKACRRIEENLVGESDVFESGMSISDLAYMMSKRDRFCMHSDHFSGYLISYYFLSESSNNNIEKYKGDIALWGSECLISSHICHNMKPENYTNILEKIEAKGESIKED